MHNIHEESDLVLLAYLSFTSNIIAMNVGVNSQSYPEQTRQYAPFAALTGDPGHPLVQLLHAEKFLKGNTCSNYIPGATI